jgi:chromosome segregation ATPase
MAMSDTDPIEAAAQRLSLALEALEAAAERRREADRAEGALADHVHALGADRARLASELDDATARARTLEKANREVGQRIDQAIETIRGVLEFGDQELTKPQVARGAWTDDRMK